MKKQLFLLLLVAVLPACSNDGNKEIEEKRKALEEKKTELKEQQEIAALDAEIQELDQQLKKKQAPAQASPASSSAPVKSLDEAQHGRIVGDRVGLRGAASVQAERLGNFNNGEQVDILSHVEAANTNEAVLTDAIQFYSANASGNSTLYQLPKGKAVVLQEYIQATDSYRVSYQHPEWGKLEAVVKANLLDNILNQKWYQVRRSSGQTGWVLGKFLLAI